MKQVKIINGLYGYKPQGAKFVAPVHAGALCIVTDEEAARLVSEKVAVYVSENSTPATPATVATPPVAGNGGGEGDTAPESGTGAEGAETSGSENATDNLDSGGGGDPGSSADDGGDELPSVPAYSVEMKVDQLRPLLERFGLAFKVGMTKADMVAALDEYFSAAPDDDEEPPVLGAEVPEV